MRFFVDSVDMDEIARAQALGLADGVTTNPTLVAKSGRAHEPTIKNILKRVKSPVCVETVYLTADEIVKEGLLFRKWGREVEQEKNVYVKIPVCREGLAAVRRLSEQGIPTTVTLVFTAAQAIAAAKAGASFICPFVGRLDDAGRNGMEVVRQIVDCYRQGGYATQVLAASIRTVDHVVGAALAGSHAVTIPPKLIDSLLADPLTDKGIAQFVEDAKKIK